MKNKFTFLIYYITLQLIQITKAATILYTNYEYLSTVKLNNYAGYYGNVNILRFQIPKETISATWFYQVRAAASCLSTPIYIYLEYSGYPVVAPLNETFPSYFDSKRLTSLVAFVSVAGAGSSFGTQNIQITVSSPKPGYWYSAVFYLNKGEKYSSTCYFFLASLTNVMVNNDTISIYPNKPIVSTYISTTNVIYKYLTTSNYIDPITFTITLTNPTSLCSLTGLLREAALPILASKLGNDAYITCNQTTINCSLSFQTPLSDTLYYVAISSNCNYTISLTVNSLSSSAPVKTTRFISSSSFITKYYLTSNSNNVVSLSNDSVYFYEFLFDQSNIGGTLNLYITNRISSSLNTTNLNGNVYLNACLMYNTLNNYATCTQGYKLKTQSFTAVYTYMSLNVAYPMIGKWNLVLWLECVDNTTNASISCSSSFTATAILQVASDQCANDYCGDYGTCNIVNSQTNLFSACKCKASYQGYGCTDASGADSLSGYIGKVLFLTLSNLVFIAPVFLALHRRWFIESLMYFYSMFFSTFYHACDQQFYALCIFNYNGLQLADFISAYSSFVITVLSMSNLPRHWKVFSYFIGILLCISVNLHDRFSTTAFIVLIVLSSVLTVATWAQVWWKTRKLFPSKKQLLLYLPGLVLSITGVVIYSALENDNNYWILHSIWHMLIAFSVVFFMPPCEGKTLFPLKKLFFKKRISVVDAPSSTSTDSSNISDSSIEQASSVTLNGEIHRSYKKSSQDFSTPADGINETNIVINRTDTTLSKEIKKPVENQ